MKKSVYKLDPTSDRYRVCPNPECEKKHMVTHRGKDYCSNECADTDYNRKRRLTNHVVSMLSNGGTIGSIQKEQQAVTVNKELSDEEWKVKMKANMDILNQLEIDPEEGTIFGIQDILDKGVAFGCSSTSGP
jgi:hypothetical protein